MSADFRDSFAYSGNLYGDGHAAEKIVEVLRGIQLGDRLVVKRFHEEGSGGKA